MSLIRLRHRRAPRAAVAPLALLIAVAAPLEAQIADSARLSVQRIFGSPEFVAESFGPTRWLDDSTYTTLEAGAEGEGPALVRIERRRKHDADDMH